MCYSALPTIIVVEGAALVRADAGPHWGPSSLASAILPRWPGLGQDCNDERKQENAVFVEVDKGDKKVEDVLVGIIRLKRFII